MLRWFVRESFAKIRSALRDECIELLGDAQGRVRRERTRPGLFSVLTAGTSQACCRWSISASNWAVSFSSSARWI